MGHVCLVTGGTRGIGAAICKSLKAAGHTVAANYGGNDEAAAKFKAETGIAVYKWNIGSWEECQEGVKKVQAELGPIEILINNAGITRDAMFHRMTVDQWRQVIDTNLNSLFYMTRPVIDGMRERNFGRVIIISSMNGQKGQMGQSNYASAKAGEVGFAKCLALENARKGITVNVVSPGYIATDMVAAIPKDVLEKQIIPLIPIGRMGDPDEIARAVMFLVDDKEGYITGATISVNGGQYMP